MAPIDKPRRARRHHANPPARARSYLSQHLAASSCELALHCVFETYHEIIEAACDAWQKLIAKPETITSIAMRQWAHVGHTQRPLVQMR